MSASEEAAAAFIELHSRIKSLEDTVQGICGKWCKWSIDKVDPLWTARQHKWNSEGRETRRCKIDWSKACR